MTILGVSLLSTAEQEGMSGQNLHQEQILHPNKIHIYKTDNYIILSHLQGLHSIKSKDDLEKISKEVVWFILIYFLSTSLVVMLFKSNIIWTQQ
jgi:hypothetical protein